MLTHPWLHSSVGILLVLRLTLTSKICIFGKYDSFPPINMGASIRTGMFFEARIFVCTIWMKTESWASLVSLHMVKLWYALICFMLLSALRTKHCCYCCVRENSCLSIFKPICKLPVWPLNSVSSEIFLFAWAVTSPLPQTLTKASPQGQSMDRVLLRFVSLLN